MGKARRLMPLALGFTYIGSVVGAGFASGQEILQFFTLFGKTGGFGIALSTALFAWLGAEVLDSGRLNGARSHLDVLGGDKRGGFRCVLDATITLYLFSSLVAMCAGGGAVAGQLGVMPPWLGSLLMAVAGSVTVVGGVAAVLGAIGGIAPIMLCFVVTISVLSLFRTQPQPAMAVSTPNPLVGNWAGAGLLYVSYNMLGAIPILAPMGSRLRSRRGAVVAGLLGGLGLGVAAYLTHLALLNQPGVAGSQVPLVAIGKGISQGFGSVYAVVIVAEVYTTAVASLYGLSVRLGLGWRGLAIVAFSAWLLSQFGLQGVVRRIYPIMGYIGLALSVTLAWNALARRFSSRSR